MLQFISNANNAYGKDPNLPGASGGKSLAQAGGCPSVRQSLLSTPIDDVVLQNLLFFFIVSKADETLSLF